MLYGHAWDGESPMGRNLDETSGTEAGVQGTRNKRRELKTSVNWVCDRPDRAIKCLVNASPPGSPYTPYIRISRSILKTPIRSTDHDLVRHALVDFDELADLPSESREQLVADLVKSICFARGGVKAGKHGVSDKALGKQIFLSDVGRALERVGLSATRWRKTYEGDGPDIDAPESFFFRLARELANVFGITLPKDLKLPGMRAAQHQYGVMSPAMKLAGATSRWAEAPGSTGPAAAP